MASIETLIAQIQDATLREKLAREVAEMKKRLDWGLVFERHLPENVRALSGPVEVGTVVWERRTRSPRRLRVRALEGPHLVVVEEPEKTTTPPDAPTDRVPSSDVLVELDFSDPVFPVPVPIDAVRRGPDDRPHHVVINGENYHAIQSLLFAYEGKADLLYLDPPYNTGDHDWSYNNNFIDPTDSWRPSKWLAFMERRLRLGRRLLRPDGVMVVTIDRFEVHHLGMLLEQMFPDALRQMVTICINPSGASSDGLARADEYAFFLFFGQSAPVPTFEDFLTSESKRSARWWESLLRGGSTWTRAERPNLCYPVHIDADGRIAGAGEPFEGEDDSARPTKAGKYDLAWPVRNDGALGIWHVGAARLLELHALGYAYVSSRDTTRGTWTLKYLPSGGVKAIENDTLEVRGRGSQNEVLLGPKGGAVVAKTMWHRGRHTAGGAGGTSLVAELTGKRGAFSYPKSVYAVRDAIDVAIGDRSDALIVDFFAGSGTTLHATMMLNARDGAGRRCVLVTNNELNYTTAQRLNRQGHFVGDPAFEAAGVFEAATRPRVVAAVTGQRQDHTPLQGTYLDDRDYAAGYEENVEFFRLDYLSPAEVEFGLKFASVHPLLWLKAGGIGERQDVDSSRPLELPANSPYAILFDPSGVPELVSSLRARSDVTHVFIVADSAESFSQTASDLPGELETVRLYRDYLETMRGARR
ncbi:MAG: DNA methyltransferase [Actinomycetota bacterium]